MSLTAEVAKRLTASLDLEDNDETEQNAIDNPKILWIASTLNDNLLLVEPVKQWIEQKLAEMAAAQLSVLYTPEQLAAMKEKWGMTDNDSPETIAD